MIISLFLLLILFDMQNALSRCRRILRIDRRESSDDFTIVVPVYGKPRYFENGWHLLPMRENVLLLLNCDSKEMVEFADVAENSGWRIHRAQVEGNANPPKLLKSALSEINTTYVIRMDADTYTEEYIGFAVAAMHKAGKDVCSVKVLPSRRKTVVEKIQGVEYDVSMLGRHMRPWLTSGACIMARREAWEKILAKHSLWFPGEDMETGLIAKHFRLKIGHIDFKVFTAVPDTLQSWFRQRRGWWCGNFRQVFVNFDHMLRYPAFITYNAILIWALMWGKAYAALTFTQHLPTIILLYTLVTLVSNWQVRSRWMIAYPYYALFQAMIMPLIGAIHYVRMWRAAGYLGRYNIGLRRAAAGSA
jgi:cellulose synthase/poly-beta-1,6-N-acetylglucosamine synthase-like glycosyltransferase